MTVPAQDWTPWLGVGTAVTSLLATAGVLRWARRRGLLDHPNERSSHSIPTPSGGGLGMVVAWCVAFPLAALSTGDTGLLWLWGGLVLASVVGFVDDRRPLSATAKFAGILVAAACVAVWSHVEVVWLPWIGHVGLAWAGLPLTVVWLALFANAFNFMDGIDGIAAGTAVATCAVLGFAAHVAGASSLGVGALLIGAGALGFLPWNAPRARLFMGDAGSLPLGIALAALVVVANGGGGEPQALPFPAGWVLLGPFVFDVGFTLVRRARRGARLGAAHREHLYQRLSRAVGSHPAVSLLYATLSVVFGLVALRYGPGDDLASLLSLLGPLAAMLGFATLVTWAESHAARVREDR